MKIGDKVIVTSLISPTGAFMKGTIVCVVPALRHPGGDVSSEGIDFDFSKFDAHAIGGGARDTESYLVQLWDKNPFDVHPPPQLPTLIWPKNESIEVVSTIEVTEDKPKKKLTKK